MYNRKAAIGKSTDSNLPLPRPGCCHIAEREHVALIGTSFTFLTVTRERAPKGYRCLGFAYEFHLSILHAKAGFLPQRGSLQQPTLKRRSRCVGVSLPVPFPEASKSSRSSQAVKYMD